MAEALRCTQCGGSLPSVAPELASVPCPSCAHVNRIAGEVLEQLHNHRREVAQVRTEAANAGEFAAFAESTRSFGNGWAWFIVASWIVAGVVAMPETPLATALALGIALGPIGIMIVVAHRRHKRAGAQVVAGRAPEQAAVVHCPTCGGQNEFAPGAPVAACRYCSGALAAEASERASLLAAAFASRDLETRKATVQGWRLAAHNNRDPRTEIIPFLVIGMIGGIFVAASLALDIQQLFAFDPARPHGLELLGLNLVSAAIVAVVVVPLLIRRRRKLRWYDDVEDLAVHCNAQSSRKLDALADYLAAHWLGDWPSRHLCAGLHYVLVCASGPPWWALSIAPFAQEEGAVERHLRIAIPGNPGGELLQGYATRLGAIGLPCDCREGGLVASLTGDAVETFLAADGLEELSAIFGVATSPT